jgi:hypothetical protein
MKTKYLCLLMVPVLLWSVAIAAEKAIEIKVTPVAGEVPDINPLADKIMKTMGEFLKTAESFSFHAEIAYDDVLLSGRKLQYGASVDVAIRRPNKLRTIRRGDLRNSRAWYDGKNLTVFHTDKQLYAVFSAPGKIDDAIDQAVEKYGLSVPLADLAYSDPYKIFTENVQAGFYEGLHSVGGVKCHHLSFIQDEIDWQIWVEDGKQLVPRKIVITYKNQPGAPQYTAVLSQWDFSVHLPDTLFRFQPPEGAEQIEFLPVAQREAKDEERRK